jgi:hypothetical protein
VQDSELPTANLAWGLRHGGSDPCAAQDPGPGPEESMDEGGRAIYPR